MPKSAKLVLEDDTIMQGESFGHPEAVAGEVVFNTGMVGYTESLTDPSYRGQILVLTYPLVGNYGVPPMSQDNFGLPVGFESDRIQIAGLVVSEHSVTFSHHTATRSLSAWLKSENIPAVFDVDTRALTKKLREQGSMLGKIEFDDQQVKFYDPNAGDLASMVYVKDVVRYEAPTINGSPSPTVVLLDCGCKANIIRSLLKRGVNVVRVPHDYYFLNLDFDGLVISNGPGDPKKYMTATRNVERALAVGRPIFGICLGHQILAQAAGAETYKLKFGHRSHNQPCLEQPGPWSKSETPERCYITSQNHGYAVRAEGLPSDWRVWFTNVNDGTVEGVRHISKPFGSVQFHPEATPGPVDTAGIFDTFVSQIGECR